MKVIFCYTYCDEEFCSDQTFPFEAESVEAAKNAIIKAFTDEYKAMTGFLGVFNFHTMRFYAGSVINNDVLTRLREDPSLVDAITWDDFDAQVLTLDEWFEQQRIDLY